MRQNTPGIIVMRHGASQHGTTDKAGQRQSLDEQKDGNPHNAEPLHRAGLGLEHQGARRPIQGCW